MMQADDLLGANEETLREIVNQAQLRIEGQNSFATAADQRAATLTGICAALAAAAIGASGQSYVTAGIGAFSFSTFVASVGFFLAAYFALRSAQCVDFHPAGYWPRNFVEDVQVGKARIVSLREMAEDYETRLAFNNRVLVQRGAWIERAILGLWLSPAVALATFVGWLAAAK